MAYPNPIIFVHGIQGSWLKNQYPVDYQDEIYWTAVLKKDFDKLHLNSLDSRIDQDIDKFIFPHQAVPLIYEGIVDELRREVTEQTYMFTYDWRKDNRYSARQLGEFVDLVLLKARTHAEQEKTPAPAQVSLIGHSMGGMVIKWYVTQILKGQAADLIDKIITIATPYRGSLKAVEAILPGARNFFGLEANKSMRAASRTLPGVYQLLPSWDKAVINKATGQNVDIFQAGNWQDNLLKAMEQEYGPDFFPKMLKDAGDFSEAMKADYPPELRNKFYCLVGTGSMTWKQVSVDFGDGNWFDFENAQEDKDGDGTVHMLSAKVPADEGKFQEFERSVPRDLKGGQHAQLPNHSEVQDYIEKLFTKSEYLYHFVSRK